MEGAAVTVVDSRGSAETCSQTTSSTGVVNCALSSGMTAPYFIQANKGTVSLYAVLPDTASRVNVTPISTAMAKKFASDNSLTPEQIIGQPTSMTSTSRATAQAAVELINAVIKVIALQTAGINIDNALTQQYTAAQTDNLDKIIHNLNITTDSTGITITVPTSTATVNINVAFNTSKQAAESAVTTSTAGVSADLNSGTAIDAAIDSFFALAKDCKTVAKKEELVAMIDARAYTINGQQVKLINGRTLGTWVDNLCETGIGSLKRTYTKTLARYGNKIIIQLGTQTADGEDLEFPLALINRGTGWKILSDNMPINMFLKTRHALELRINAETGSEKFYYLRYLDTWVDDEISGAVLPDKIELYAIPLKQVDEKFTSQAFTQLQPFVTLYKTQSQYCPYNLYVPRSDRGASNCDSLTYDSAIPSFFGDLEQHDFTHIIVKLLDSGGACLNCDSAGLPESGDLVGKAYPVSKIFGTSVTATDLATGIDRSKFPAAAISAYRTFYAAPSEADLTDLSTKFRSTAVGSTVRIPWQRATRSKSQINGQWGGVTACGVNQRWTDIPDSPFISNKNDYWDVAYPIAGSSFDNSQYLSFTIATGIQQSEFAFYVNVERSSKCKT